MDDFIIYHAQSYIDLMNEFGQAFGESVEEEVLMSAEMDDDFPEAIGSFVKGDGEKLKELFDKHIEKLAKQYAEYLWSTKDDY